MSRFSANSTFSESNYTRNKTAGVNRGSTMCPRATFSVFIFSLSSQLFHRRSFLLVPPSSLLLLPTDGQGLLQRWEHAKLHFNVTTHYQNHLKVHKSPFFIDIDESVTDGRIDGPTDQRTDRPSQRDARTHLRRYAFNLRFTLLPFI